MQFGFNLPNTGALAAPDNVVRIAREGETLGYDYLTVTDHVVLPDMAEPGYPYSESGAFYSRDSAYRHEMLTLAAYLAAATAKLRIVLAVLVVPHRPAVLATKMLSTIDVLSDGRLTVGIGAGWLKAEFDAVVTTPFAERGAVTDEYLAAFRTLWTEDKPRIDGRYVRYDGLVLAPKPVQKPHPLRPRRHRHRLRFRAAARRCGHCRNAVFPRPGAGKGVAAFKAGGIHRAGIADLACATNLEPPADAVLRPRLPSSADPQGLA